MNPALLQQLTSIVGAAHVLASGDLSAYERDWRGRMQGKAMCVVKPESTDEVAQVVKACAAADAAIVPQGGNTSLVVGAVPDTSGTQVVLSLQRMNRIRSLDKANLTLTAEAGCILQHVQQAATQAGLLFPLSLASEGTCTIGGNLGSNAGGTQVLRYGNARDLCLGLEVVTPQGDVWHGLSGLRKDNTGYDLRNIFIGSEGTLGVITAATLKLYPQAAAELTSWAAVPSMKAAVQLLGLAQQHLGAGLTGFEVMGQFALQLVNTHFPTLNVPLWQTAPYCVLLSHSDTENEAHGNAQLERLLETALHQGCASDAVVASSLAQGRQLWQVRESISSAQAAEGLNIKHDISLPVSAIPDFVAHTDALLAREIDGVRLVNFGHLGDGNLHYNVQCPVGGNAADFLAVQEPRIKTLVFEAVMRFGGSISAEHGVGSLKADTLHLYKDPVALQLMRSIKQAIDPQNVMNPGRVLAIHYINPM
jgi:FAD/FMN-containing dehydrogenase